MRYIVVFFLLVAASFYMPVQATEPFPDEVRQEFVDSCMEGTGELLKPYCTCAIQKIEESMTLNELIAATVGSDKESIQVQKLETALNYCVEKFFGQ